MKKRSPVLFVGHGSPMNAIENNNYSLSWKEMGKYLNKPKVILAISAHWFGPGLKIRDVEENTQIYDMYGFPDELYQIKYEPKGSPEYARKIINLLGDDIIVDNSWGVDHGIWSVLVNMYPEADIPVVMMSIDSNRTPQEHFKIGQKISSLREEGVLILASGNIVHNLGLIDWHSNKGYTWAEEFDNYIKESILNRDVSKVINYKNSNSEHGKAFHISDHFDPLLVALGAIKEDDKISVWNNECILGSLSMTSYLFE